MLLYVALLAAAILAMLSLRTCDMTSVTPLRDKGGSHGDTIDVALVYAPMSYYIYADTLGGYNYDLLRDIAAHEGVVMKFWPVNSLTDALRLLRQGKYDILATLPEDAAYKQMATYSTPVFLDRQVLVQQSGADNPVRSALDLAGDTVHIEAGSPIAARLRNLSHEIGDTIYVCEHTDMSSELLVLAVQSGKIRFAVVNERIARPLTGKFGNLDVGSPISFTQFQGIVAAPGDSATVRRVNGWLERAAGRGSVRRLREKYGLD